MLVGIQGTLGAGKTVTMVMLMQYLHHEINAQLHANNKMQNSKRISTTRDLWEMENGVFGFDEIWVSLDSRSSKANVVLSHWVNQSRKKKLVVFYTTQHIRQVDLRVRNATDILICVEKKPDGIKLLFIDWQYRRILRQYFIPDSVKRKFYPMYDTYEVIQPIIDNGHPGDSDDRKKLAETFV